MGYSDRSLTGIHGWLAFFILTLGVFGPLRTLVGIYTNLYANPSIASFYGRKWQLLQAFEWMVVLVSVAGSIYLAWRLYAVHRPSTPRIVIAGLWLFALVFPIVEATGVSLISGITIRELTSDTTRDLVRSLVYAGIWTAYLLRSRRVANTYTDTADDDLAAVFD